MTTRFSLDEFFWIESLGVFEAQKVEPWLGPGRGRLPANKATRPQSFVMKNRSVIS